MPSDNNKESSDIEKGSSSGGTDATTDPNVVDWDGPNDPDNPLNWPSWKKVVAIGLVSFMSFLSPFASTIIAPGTDLVMKEFESTNKTVGTLVTSVYLLGYTVGPLVLAPLSELYGRNIFYNVCNVLFLVFNIGCAKANNLPALVVLRLLAGTAAVCPITLGVGSIADMIPHERRGLAMAAWVIGPILGPSIGPIAGGYLSDSKGWRWNFWLVSIIAGAAVIMTFLGLQESHPYTLLERKTKKLRKATSNPDLRSALHSGKSSNEFFRFSILRPLKMLCFSPICLVLSLYMAVIYGYLYLFFTTFPRVFGGQYGFSRGSSGLVYLGIGIGSFAGLVLLGATMDRTTTFMTKKNGGKAKPEYRLPSLVMGALLVPAGLFWYGWTAQNNVHWMVPIIGSGFVGAGILVAMMAISTYLVDEFTTYAASASAATTFCRSLLGALLPLAGEVMYDKLDIGWGTSVLGFIAIAFLPVPFLLYRYGERIRDIKIFNVEF